jgi:multiple sugar transport system substrate-binding protein
MAQNPGPAPAPRPRRLPKVAALGIFALAAVVVAAAVFVSFRPSAGPTASPSPSPGDTVVVRWFVGLGSGTQPNAIDPETEFVRRFNESQSRIYINLEKVSNKYAYDVLKTQIAAGSAPDIVGPVGVRGRNGFAGVFMDLTPLIASHHFDTRDFEPALVRFMAQGNDGLVGLPYLMYPAFMFYNKDLFEAAGLPDLPAKVGEPYMGKTWDWNNLSEIAARLTLDDKGRRSTDPAFDAGHIAQWGIDFQWWDARRMASAFGGGSFVGSDGRTAQIPEVWREAWSWYYEAMWVKHYAPTGEQVSGKLLNEGVTISSGRIAMGGANGWAINSYGSFDSEGASTAEFKAWDIAVMPSWKGQTSGPIDMDTLLITKSSAHPDEAFEAMLAIMADKNLQIIYGGMPARIPDQQAWFDSVDTFLAKYVFPGNQVNWSVLQEMSKYPAIPSHEADMPNPVKAIEDYGAFYTRLQNTPGLDVDAELDALRITLQADFDAGP